LFTRRRVDACHLSAVVSGDIHLVRKAPVSRQSGEGLRPCWQIQIVKGHYLTETGMFFTLQIFVPVLMGICSRGFFADVHSVQRRLFF
jgi:hypothetical protein